jgi:hypothetical protein
MRLVEICRGVSGPTNESSRCDSYERQTSATQTSAMSAQTSAVIDVSTWPGMSIRGRGLIDLCGEAPDLFRTLRSEATAGIEPAIEGFADFSCIFSLSVREH